MPIAIGGNRSVVQPVANPLMLALLGVHFQQIHIVLVQRSYDGEKQPIRGRRQVEVRIFDRSKADVVLPKKLKELKRVVLPTREPR